MVFINLLYIMVCCCVLRNLNLFKLKHCCLQHFMVILLLTLQENSRYINKSCLVPINECIIHFASFQVSSDCTEIIRSVAVWRLTIFDNEKEFLLLLQKLPKDKMMIEKHLSWTKQNKYVRLTVEMSR